MRLPSPRHFGPSALACALALVPSPAAAQDVPFAITVQDAATGAPVPCVTLRTVNQIPFTSDEHGVIAFFEPGLMDQDVFFSTRGPPWELPADGFGFTGRTLHPTLGGTATLEVSSTGTAPPCSPGDGPSRLVADGLPPLDQRHGIRVLDAVTSRGVPLVELRAQNRTWVTDSAGWVAILEPEHLGATTTVQPVSHGYATPEPVALTLLPGGRSSITLTRQIPAERLYRVTGGGIYRDSVLLGEPTPLAQPLLNALVVGMDSTHTAVHDGRLFWVWGDTLRPSYPLGHFGTSGATSLLPTDGGLAPAVGVDLTYFTRDDGFARPVADIVDDGLVWTDSLISLPTDPPELVAHFAHIGGTGDGGWTELGGGMMRWDPTAESFERIATHPDDIPAKPTGTAFLEGEHVYFTDISGDPSRFQVVRAPATLAALADPSTYETWTAIDSTGTLRRAGDRPDYAWRAAAPPTRPGDADDDRLISGHLSDPLADTDVGDHIGSVFWNPHLGRYLRIAARPFGDDAFLGETWLSVADTPMGPWAWATQVVTHDDYSFYNPRHHPEFDEDGGRVVTFEGTYANTFSGTDIPTPRYDYNQVMYRVDLDALTLPVPVYGRALSTRDTLPADADADPAVFFALDRPADDAIALRWTGPDCAPRSLAEDGAGELAFWAPSTASSPQLVPLYPLADPGRGTRYVLARPPGAEPIAFVWPNPIDLPFPVHEHPGPVHVHAGPDQCNESGATTLRAAATDGAVITWSWPDGEATGPELSLDLPDGVHVFTATATVDGAVDRDVVVVEIGGTRACGCTATARPRGLGLLMLCLCAALAWARRR